MGACVRSWEVGRGLSTIMIGRHESCAKVTRKLGARVGLGTATLTLEPQPTFISFSFTFYYANTIHYLKL